MKFIEFYDIVYGTLSLSEISASVRGSCPCAHSAVLSSFVLSPLVPDELGVAALRPSLGCGHLHAAIGAASPSSTLLISARTIERIVGV